MRAPQPAHYGRGQEMLAHAQRDAQTLPALAAVLAPWEQFMEMVREDLWMPWPAEAGRRT
jgi:hypothetical protein